MKNMKIATCTARGHPAVFDIVTKKNASANGTTKRMARARVESA